jgi:hypothetical protein
VKTSTKSPPRVHPLPRSPIVQAILLGGFGVAVSLAWLVYHLTHTPPPIRVPVSREAGAAAPAPTYDAGEMPVPNFEDVR